MLDIRLKTIPDDFIVYERQGINLSFLSNDMKYIIILLNKKGYTTFEAVSILAAYIKIDSSLIRYSGLKDEDGITYQSISIPNNINNIDRKIKLFNEKYYSMKSNKYIESRIIGYSNEKLNIGKLEGNSFRITLRNITRDVAEKLITIKKYRITFPNYYDTQRFGLPNMPKFTHLIGEALINKDFNTALKYMKDSDPDNYNKAKIYDNCEKYFALLDKRKLSFYYSSFFSYKFNEFLKKEIGKVIKYEKLIYDNLEYFIPLRGNDLENLNNDIKKIRIPRYNIDKDMKIETKYFYRYSYMTTIINIISINKDIFFDNKFCVDVEFFIPSGCYATMVIKQLISDIDNCI